jgi:hypothetical protein
MKIYLIMAFVLACDITIGAYRFRQVNEVRIEKSWREMTDKCEIRLPALRRRLEEVIKPGDPVSVKLWYTGKTQTEEFNGYVRRVSPNIPFEVECEDHIYFFRKTQVKKSWSSTTLKDVIQYLVDQVNEKHPTAKITVSSKLPDVTLKPFVIEAGNTAATALQKIKEGFGLVSYFKGRELFTGLAYQQTFGNVKYSFAWNVITNELTYRSEDDIQLKVKAIGITGNNSKVTVDDVGDKDGELRTLYFYNVSDKAQLKKLAEEELTKLKYTGYEGSVDTFLYPYAEPLMTAEIFDPKYGEKRAGKYVIDSVKTLFGAYGARRTVELGVKLSA